MLQFVDIARVLGFVKETLCYTPKCPVMEKYGFAIA